MLKIVLFSLAFVGATSSHRILVIQKAQSLEHPTRMHNQQENNIEREFTRPWSERRGIQSVDRNASLLLVKAPLDTLSAALEKSALETRRNVLGSEIELSGYFVFAYQLVGHPWSIMVPDCVRREANRNPQQGLLPSDAQLSKELKQPVIRLNISDTSNTIGYQIFEDGEIIEYFQGEHGYIPEEQNRYEIQTQRYIIYPSADESFYGLDLLEAKYTVHFWSRHRQISGSQINNIWDFVKQLLVEYDAFDPAISCRGLLATTNPKRGERYRIQNLGFTQILPSRRVLSSTPDLVRVDYFRFGN
jgi:hypothetical protein